MSLRDAFRATLGGKVACCASQATQRATLTSNAATVTATPAQQQTASPRECLNLDATADATGAQQASCATPEKCPEKVARVARGSLTQHRAAAALIDAVSRCCEVRGDDDANRTALIAECLTLTPRQQEDMHEHFEIEAERWERACGVIR